MILPILLIPGLTLLATKAPAGPERLLFDGRRAQGLRFSGQAWKAGNGYIEGAGKGNRLWSREHIGAGDFRIRARLEIRAVEHCAAAFAIGKSWFGFAASRGDSPLFVAGPLFHGGKAGVTLLPNTERFIHEGSRFLFEVERRHDQLLFRIDGQVVTSRQVALGPLGPIGIEPQRGRVRLFFLGISGEMREDLAPVRAKLRKLQPRIDRAIARGVDFLLANQHRDGSWTFYENQFRSGQTALCAYTLLKAGLAPEHPAVRCALAFMERFPPHETYTVACHLMTLEATHDPAQHARMKELLAALTRWQNGGTWGYPFARKGSVWQEEIARSDLSNTQYAALGLRAATLAGLRVPAKAWNALIEGTLGHQMEPRMVAPQRVPGGTRTGKIPLAGFSYRPGGAATGSMTTAGISILAICEQGLGARLGRAQRNLIRAQRRAGLEWLARNFRVDANPGRKGWVNYYLYGLERVGSLLGTEKIGAHFWYLEGARRLVSKQGPKGAWGSEADTCFAILFLKRATAPPATGANARPWRKPKIYAAENPADDVHLRASGEADLSLWITGFRKELRASYAASHIGDLRIARVEYLVDGRVVRTLAGDPARPWARQRYATRYTFDRPGTYKVLARVHLVAPDAPLSERTPSRTVTSRALAVKVTHAFPPWLESYARVLGSNWLNRPIERRARASSAWNKNCGAGRAFDGRDDSHWMCAAKDTKPWIRIDLARSVRTNTIILAQAASRAAQRPDFDRIQRVELILNRRRKILVELEADPLRPTTVTIDPPQRISSLEVRVLARTPGGKYRGGGGFAEIGMYWRRAAASRGGR